MRLLDCEVGVNSVGPEADESFGFDLRSWVVPPTRRDKEAAGDVVTRDILHP